MNQSTPFLLRFAASLLAGAAMFGASVPAHAAVALPLYGAQPELVVALMLMLAAVAAALLLQRRAGALEERSRTLEAQLHAERSAHADVETALAGSHEVLCRLVRQQETVRESERCRIARELHDELGHRLLALRVELALQQAAVRGTSPGVHDKATQAVANLDAAIRAVRTIVAGLRPIAQGVTLRQAAERHLADFARLHGLDYRFDTGADALEDHRRDREIDSVLFRVLQESLSNIARHAQATLVCVSLVESARELTLTIEDDGIGLPPEPGPGSGVNGMRERVEAYGGSLRFANGRRGGAIVSVSLPTHLETVPV
jgi:signal transduction histidine kinase